MGATVVSVGAGEAELVGGCVAGWVAAARVAATGETTLGGGETVALLTNTTGEAAGRVGGLSAGPAEAPQAASARAMAASPSLAASAAIACLTGTARVSVPPLAQRFRQQQPDQAHDDAQVQQQIAG